MGEELFLLYFSPSCSIKTQALQSCLIVYKGSFHKRIQSGDAVIKKNKYYKLWKFGMEVILKGNTETVKMQSACLWHIL